MRRIFIPIIAATCILPLQMNAQQVLTLEECRQMAIESNKDLDQARTKVEMAGYDRKIARANYFPEISATGAYLYNNRNLSLVSDSQSAMLTNMGTSAQGALDQAVGAISGKVNGAVTQLSTAIMSDPRLAAEYMNSPMWQTVLNMLKESGSGSATAPDIATPINAIGQDIDKSMHLDIENVFIGAVTLKQPVFVGGKIVLSNQIAKMAEELARAEYDMKYADVLVDIDQAYWQIVSIANKKKLAESYSDLLHQLEKDVAISVQEGVATKSDELQIKVKANEADMMLTKATNGLELAKMLLCKQIGLPLDSQITLSDEALDAIPVPVPGEEKSMEDIWEDRAETRSLELATKIYDKKIGIARADMMPQIALVAGYSVTNPNAFHGYENSWNGGLFSAGVMVNVPIFHGTEAYQRTRKAKAEATLYRDKLEDARNMINLQVEQSRQHLEEARERLLMSENNLSSAEENMRMATVGFEAGVIETNTVLAAQTAWLQAHSEYIDAGIDLQMANANLRKAEGYYNIDNE